MKYRHARGMMQVMVGRWIPSAMFVKPFMVLEKMRVLIHVVMFSKKYLECECRQPVGEVVGDMHKGGLTTELRC